MRKLFSFLTFTVIVSLAKPVDSSVIKRENSDESGSAFSYSLASTSTPTSLSATIQAWNQVYLTWVDNSADETAFKIERSGDGVNFTEIASAIPNETAYLDTNLAEETQYFYRVIAAGTTPVSDYSNTVEVTTPNAFFRQDKTSLLTQHRSYGQAWSDFDRDGDLDVFLFKNAAPNVLLRNDGNGNFTEHTSPTFSSNNSRCAVWIDVNGDSYPDLFVGNSSTNNLYINQGDGSFISGTTPPNTDFETIGCNAADADQDGDMDLFLVDSFTGVFLYQNDGSGSFSKNNIDNNIIVREFPGISDLNGDRLPDIVVTTNSSRNEYYSNTGTGFLKTTNALTSETMNSYGISWGDFDNNGFQDAFVTNENSKNRLYKNDNYNFTEEISATPVVDNGISRGSAWGDYDNDGFIDLFVANGQNNNELYHNNGNATFTKVLEGEMILDNANSRSCAWIDFDNDGDLDLYVTNTLDNNLLYVNQDGNLNNWVFFKLEGTVSNDFGVGAKVRIEADMNGNGNVWLMRELSNQSGYASQSDLKAHFGLGNATVIKSLTVEWPSGTTQSYQDLEINQVHTIIEKPRPSAPVDLTALANSSSSVNITWTDNTNENTYLLERSVGSPDNYSILATLPQNTTSYSDLGLTTSTTYYYRLKAVNESSESDYSTEVSATTVQNTLVAPSQLTAVAAGVSQIELTWINNEAGATGFVIERSTPDNSAFAELTTVAATESTYTDQGLSENTTYFYRIKAIDASASSGYSDEANATTNFNPVTAPSNLNITASSTIQVDLAWTNNAANADQVVIERSTPDNSNFTELATLAATETTYSDQGLQVNTTYFYRVKAINSITSSGYSNEVAVTTDAAMVDAPSQLIATTVSDSEIDLSWINNASNATQVVIERSSPDNSGFVEISTVAATETTFNDQGLVENTTYFYRIMAINAVVSSTYSAEANATTNITPVDAPLNLVATSAGYSQIDLAWTNTAINATQVIIERSSPDNTAFIEIATIAASENTFSDQGLEPETSYHYRLKAINSLTESNYSNESSITTNAVIINAPANLAALATSTDQIDLSWTDQSDNESEFVIERSEESGSGFTEIARVAANMLSYSDLGLMADTKFYYQVKAINQYTESAYSNESNATTFRMPVSLSFPEISAEPGTSVAADLTVTNFSNILATQFSISWDPAVVEFTGISNHVFTGMQFNELDVSNGILSYTWDDLQAQPQTLADGSVLFSLEFTVIGANGTSSSININDIPTSVEISDQDLQPIGVILNPGLINSQDQVLISGRILAVNQQPIEGAIVSISGDQVMSTNSGTDGSYQMQVLPLGQLSLEVAKTNDTNPNNGVSTLDIALIRRHVLGMMPLKNNFENIAADVNNSNSISTVDIALIRKLVLGMSNSFDAGLWRFISGFNVPDDPFSYNQNYDLNLSADRTDLDFTAVRLGDVNGSWNATNGRLKTSGVVEFLLDEVIGQKHGLVEVPIRARDFRNIAGYQFSLQWDQQLIEFQGIRNSKLEGAFNIQQAESGLITTSWDHESGSSQTLADQEIIAVLEFRVKGFPGQIAGIEINSSLTSQLAFNQDLEELNFNSTAGKVKISADGINFYQDRLLPLYPNPFSEGIHIPFELAERGNVKLFMYNAVGEMVWQHNAEFGAGIHTYELPASPVLPAGNYLISFETRNIKESMKVLHIK